MSVHVAELQGQGKGNMGGSQLELEVSPPVSALVCSAAGCWRNPSTLRSSSMGEGTTRLKRQGSQAIVTDTAEDAQLSDTMASREPTAWGLIVLSITTGVWT